MVRARNAGCEGNLSFNGQSLLRSKDRRSVVREERLAEEPSRRYEATFVTFALFETRTHNRLARRWVVASA